MRIGPSIKIARSIENLVALLEKVLSSPAAYLDDVTLRAALGSQGALAAFERADEYIFACSINTQKRVCAAQYSSEGGYARLNELRTLAQEAIQEACRTVLPKRRTREGLKEEIEELKTSLAHCRGDCMNLTNAITAAMRAARRIARESGQPALVARWAKMDAEIYRMISVVRDKRGPIAEEKI